jgi:crotonobetainyl-CoA:carnitine CoA-transferase CaiB-like acyl-CoA transferase
VYIRAPYGVFRTSDGFIALAFADPEQLGRLIGEPAFEGWVGEVEGWTKRDELSSLVQAKLLEQPTEYWLETLGGAGMWVGPVYGYEELVVDPQIIHNGTFVEYDHPTEGRVKTPGFPIKFSKTPSRVYRGAPLAGEHTRDVLREAGYPEHEIDRLIAVGAVAESRDVP